MVNSKTEHILIVDDEPDSLNVLRDFVSAWGYNVTACSSAAIALQTLMKKKFDIILTDLMMPETDGIELLKSANKIDPLLVGIIVTGEGTVQAAVEAMKTGAFDFVLKPIDWKTFRQILARAIDVRRLKQSEEKYRLLAGDQAELIRCLKEAEAEKAKLEAQLIHAQKMEAVGALAGGIAHDFNNILTAIISYANIILMKMEKKDSLRSYLDRILEASEKAAGLIHDLLTFSRKQIINPKPVDINGIIKRTEHILTQFIGENIELKTGLAVKELVVMADAGQIEQVLMNLATNARDAMPDAGSLSITTARAELDGEFIKQHGYGEPGSYALIAVTDTGEGMNETTRERIFEPFFTTKEVGKGTGLGLSMAYGIIKQHNGYINCSSEEGNGTTFYLYLPLISASAENEKPPAYSKLKRGGETILLVEDDTEARKAAKEILTESGYRVMEASNGEEALINFMENRENIRLLILDVVMPRKTGKEVFKEIKRISPDVKVLFISGYNADIINKKGISDENWDFISKPFVIHAFLEKVREVLDKSPRKTGSIINSYVPD
jgi:signal transduction histidine kinase